MLVFVQAVTNATQRHCTSLKPQRECLSTNRHRPALKQQQRLGVDTPGGAGRQARAAKGHAVGKERRAATVAAKRRGGQ